MRAIRFSTRALFVAVAVCAVIALGLSWAMQGGILGDLGIVVGVTFAMGALIVALHVVFFGLCQVFGVVAARRKRSATGTTPFEDSGRATQRGTTLGMVLVLVLNGAAYSQPPFMPAPGALFVGGGLQLSSPQVSFDQGEGYAPVRFRFQAVSPPAADRELTIYLRLGNGRSGDSSLQVTQPVTIPAGASGPIETTVLWPPSSWNGPLWFEVSEGGQPVQGLGGSINSNMMGRFPVGTAPCLAIVNGAALSGSVQGKISAEWQKAWQSQGLPGAVTPTFLGPSLADLPEEWLQYSNVDLMCLTLTDAKTLAERYPSRWRAIYHWALAGGNLLLSGLDPKWEGLAEVDRLLGNGTRDTQWTAIRLTADVKSKDSARIKPERRIQDPFKAPVLLGMGQVLVTNLTVGDIRTDQWESLVPHIGEDRLHWSARHGLTLQTRNDDFYEFLVPGVGLAPVTEFTILVTLFAVFVGPVNFYVLRQRKRLYLLMLSVPLAALLVTGGLLAYAALGEGLGVRVRARSVTHLDQRTGDAATWARLSYYAGVGPSGGLRFPSDVAVLPIYPVRREETDSRRSLHWGEDQHLASGWLQARSAVQFLTIRPRRTAVRLNVVVADGRPVRVENALGTKVTHVAVFDESARPHVAENVAAGGSAALEADGDLKAIGEALFAGRSSKELPEGVTDVQSNRGLFGMRSRADYYYYAFQRGGMGLPANMGSASRLERVLAALGGSKQTLINARHELRTYVAIVEQSPEVIFGLETVEEEASFHVIVGKW